MGKHGGAGGGGSQMTRLWGGVVIVCDQSLNFETRKGMMGAGDGDWV